MVVFGNPELRIPAEEENRVRGLVRAATRAYFDAELTFGRQRRNMVAAAVIYLEELAPALAGCKRSWGACALLSRAENNKSSYLWAKRARQAEAASATETATPSTMAESASSAGAAAPVPGAVVKGEAVVAAAVAAGADAARRLFFSIR